MPVVNFNSFYDRYLNDHERVLVRIYERRATKLRGISAGMVVLSAVFTIASKWTPYGLWSVLALACMIAMLLSMLLSIYPEEKARKLRRNVVMQRFTSDYLERDI